MRRHLIAAVLLLAGAHGAFAVEEPISFRNDVMAILSKAGCNAGPCHGNANGKGGFKLSLRGEGPELDFAALAQDQYGRRIDIFEPEQSLLLAKATAQLAHEGGQRFTTNSWEYRALVRWIGGGATNDLKTARTVAKLEVTPREGFLVGETNVQIAAKATFADGLVRDVSGLAVYESANPIVTISHDGLVTAEKPGETTVLVRYLDQQVPVRLAFVPARPEFVWSKPAPKNFVDEHVFAKLERLRMNPSELCSDEVFVRRAFLDLLGQIPTGAEARSFVFDPSPSKRKRLIDDLLKRSEFADFWALKWSDLLRAEERIMDRKGIESLYRWIRQSIHEHKPMDQFAREIIAARGSTYRNPPANFYRATRTPVERAEAAAQLFLGTRVQCAQCHNHPFDRWSQDDYYDWLSVFARVQYRVLENRRRDNNDSHEFKGEQIVYVGGSAEVKNPRTGSAAKPRFLGENERFSSKDEDELSALARWVTAPENQFFAKVQVNRIWYHLMGRGIVDPLDDFRASNPPSHPELLEALARNFIDHGYDLRQTIRVIMNSRTYQASAIPTETNAEDEANFAKSLLRRLTAEQLVDSQSRALGLPVRLAGYPIGTRAVQMAGSLPERRRGGGSADVEQLLATFGKPPRLLPTECERSTDPTMGQAFQMMNGPVLNELLDSKENCLAALLEKPEDQILEELWWRVIGRAPTAPEAQAAKKHLAETSNRREAAEDILWGLLNSKEFLFR
jgi:hypothetical protein